VHSPVGTPDWGVYTPQWGLLANGQSFCTLRLMGHPIVAFLASADTSKSAAAQDLPQPPQPYHYNEFMTWLRQADRRSFANLKWRPEVAEFDIDAAAKGKFGPYLQGPFGEEAISVTKGINKYIFLDDVMLSGQLDVVGAPGTHLYILRRLLEAAEGSSHPTFLDAGCGPGYLLMAWALGTGEGSRAVGIDVDAAVVASARRHLAATGTWDADVVRRPQDTKLEAFVGDALHPDGPAIGLPAGSVDAINLGLAVSSETALEDLAPLAQLLRTGGLLAAPICSPKGEQPSNLPKGKCAGLFEIFQKSDDGSLQRAPGDPDIPTKFIVALKPGETTGGSQGAPPLPESASLRGKR